MIEIERLDDIEPGDWVAIFGSNPDFRMTIVVGRVTNDYFETNLGNKFPRDEWNVWSIHRAPKHGMYGTATVNGFEQRGFLFKDHFNSRVYFAYPKPGTSDMDTTTEFEDFWLE